MRLSRSRAKKTPVGTDAVGHQYPQRDHYQQPRQQKAKRFRQHRSYPPVVSDHEASGRLGLKLASETSDRGRVYRIGGGYDVVVTVTGSRQTVVTFRKARVLGIWVNADLRVIENAPAYIDVLSNKPLEEVANAETLRRLQPAWATMAYPQISFHASHAGKGRNDFSGMTRPRPVMAVLVRQLPSQNTRERMLSMRSADATEMGCQKSPQQGE